MKKFKLFALAAFAMLSTNAFAANTNWLTNTVVSETAGKAYAPVGTDSKAPLVFTITRVEDNNGAGTAISVGEVEVAQNAGQMAGYTAITIPEKVTIPVTVTVGSTVKFSGTYEFTVTKVADKAFQDIKTLATVTFGGESKITAIGDKAFQGTALSSITLPSGLTKIGADAFSVGTAAYPAFNAITIPATVTEIGANAFEGCENLATFTLSSSSQLFTIGDGAFAYTSISTLDLSTATEYNPTPLNPATKSGLVALGSGTGNPFISTAHTTNAMIKKIVLPNTCVEIKANACKSLTNLKEIDLSLVKTIGANAFEGDVKLASVAIGTSVTFTGTAGIAIAADAFKGCAKLATVELGTINAGVIADAAFGAGSYPAAVTNFKFNEIKAALGTTAFNLATVTQLDFKSYIATADYVPASSFTNAFADTDEAWVINYNITLPTGVTTPVLAFNQQAFSTTDVDKDITMNTISAVQEAYTAGIYKVEISGGYSTDDIIGAGTDTKKLIKDKDSKYYYYYYKPVGKKAIARTQESGATVTVYMGYTDVVDDVATTYFIPGYVKNGEYVIPGASVVIIKSNKEDAVKATPSTNGVTMPYWRSSTSPMNSLKKTDAAVSLLKVQSDAAYLDGGNKDLWFFNNPATSGFGFTKFDPSSQTGGLAANCVYMTCPATSAARMNIVWLDEDGNTTAIQTINANAKADNGAIYNLRGEKVNASYKGLVIKDGKKYIQK
jgi:hypothetical protein